MRIHPVLLAVSLVLMPPGASGQQETDDRERTVCGFLRERLAFSLWSAVAGRPDPAAAGRVPNATPVEHLTADRRALRGYRLTPGETGGQPSGFLLMAQGNAMLADQLLDHLSAFTASGHHVYVFDYRGYGASEGRRRLKAIVDDYRELFASLSKAYEGDKLLYGVSFGGVVVSGVIGAHARFDRAVIDSTPSRVSGYGCPQAYDPVENLPQNAAHMLLINGQRDTVVLAGHSAELLETAQRRGATVIRSQQFAHPFMDPDPEIRRERTRRIISFLVAPRE